MKRAISVVIPTYNYGRFISEALDSVFVQTLRPSEVIVVDDGSEDETERVVGSFGDKVIYIRQENQGVCAARNTGVARSSCELISFLDADDYWEPVKLQMQFERFENDPELGMVHCGMREFDGESGSTVALHLDGGEDDVADSLLLWNGPVIVGPGGTIMVKRLAFDQVGGFDPEMKVGEDWDFCYRIAREFRIGFVRRPLVNYRSHSASAHRNVEEMERGMSRFYEKAFATEDKRILQMKRRAFGNFHRILAGSYFRSRNYLSFGRHLALSLLNDPLSVSYFAKFPLRRMQKTKR